MDRAKMRVRIFVLPIMRVRTFIMGKMKVLEELVLSNCPISPNLTDTGAISLLNRVGNKLEILNLFDTNIYIYITEQC